MPKYTSPPKDIIELLKIKSLKSLGLEIIKFKRDKLKAHLLKDVTSQNSSEEDLILENIKITYSVMQQLDVSEANYRVLFKEEVILSSVKFCRSRQKCTNSYEQKSDGVFTVKLRKLLIKVNHLEMSGGYRHKDIPRSTWDGCCKLPISNSYMLQEIGEQFQRIALNCGKCITRPVVFCNTNDHSLDTQCGLLETSNTIFQLRDEHNDNLFESSKLFRSLPVYPFTPNKDRHKIDIKDANEDSDLDNFPI
ncbi:unnamed protein product [Rhizophagus irregularis]|nr:unnamed protein product [Rhizophagus irregularis]